MKIKIMSIFICFLIVNAIPALAGNVLVKNGELNVTNNLIVAGSALVVDSVNKIVGIGTTGPRAPLEISRDVAQLFITNPSTGGATWRLMSTASSWAAGGGKLAIGTSPDSSAEIMYLTSDGKVGIGTASPLEKVHVNSGNLFILGASGAGSNNGLRIQYGSGNSFWVNTPSTNLMAIGGTGANPPPSGAININNAGNVGIGMTSPANKLEVNGKIYSSDDVCIEGKCLSTAKLNSLFFSKTLSLYQGDIGSYSAANSVCNKEFTGSHMCTVNEILDTIIYKNVSKVSEWAGTAWIAGGPPGYTANANDCLGFTSNSNANLGRFWDFDGTTNDGMGWLTGCNQQKAIACCKEVP